MQGPLVPVESPGSSVAPASRPFQRLNGHERLRAKHPPSPSLLGAAPAHHPWRGTYSTHPMLTRSGRNECGPRRAGGEPGCPFGLMAGATWLLLFALQPYPGYSMYLYGAARRARHCSRPGRYLRMPLHVQAPHKRLSSPVSPPSQAFPLLPWTLSRLSSSLFYFFLRVADFLRYLAPLSLFTEDLRI